MRSLNLIPGDVVRVVVDGAVHEAVVAGQLAQEVVEVERGPVKKDEQATI